jgi:hypothetical protein
MTERRNANEWTFSRHALERAVDMAIDPEELREAIERPTRPLPSVKYPGCHLLHTERIVLCVNLKERVVITVVWNTFDGQRNVRFDRDDDIERCRDSA